MSSALRVVDAGDVGAYRSQALWHGIASATRPGAAGQQGRLVQGGFRVAQVD